MLDFLEPGPALVVMEMSRRLRKLPAEALDAKATSERVPLYDGIAPLPPFLIPQYDRLAAHWEALRRDIFSARKAS